MALAVFGGTALFLFSELYVIPKIQDYYKIKTKRNYCEECDKWFESLDSYETKCQHIAERTREEIKRGEENEYEDFGDYDFYDFD